MFLVSYSRQVLTILEELCPKLQFVGMDVCEVSPPFDHAEITSQAAATFAWTYICSRLSIQASSTDANLVVDKIIEK